MILTRTMINIQNSSSIVKIFPIGRRAYHEFVVQIISIGVVVQASMFVKGVFAKSFVKLRKLFYKLYLFQAFHFIPNLRELNTRDFLRDNELSTHGGVCCFGTPIKDFWDGYMQLIPDLEKLVNFIQCDQRMVLTKSIVETSK